MKQKVPLAITFIGGVVLAIQFFIPAKASQDVFNWWVDWSLAIAPFALLLGIFSLTSVHYRKVKQRQENWPYSAVTLVCLYGMISIGLGAKILGQFEGVVDTAKALDATFNYLYDNVQVPIQATMFSLLAFYIASAAFRAFRARSLLATILLLGAVIVMLGRVPLGEPIGKGMTLGLTDGAWLEQVSSWILDIPNTASKRAINLGVGLGILATSMKIILGIERTYLGGS